MNLQPISDRIIIQAIQAEEKTSGGILLPDSAQEKPQQGKVLAVGPGKLLNNGSLSAMDIKVGDVVLYGKYSGTEVTVSGNEYIILRSSDVLAVMQNAPSMASV